MYITKANLSHLEKLAPLFNAYRVFYDKPSDLLAAREFLSTRICEDESVIFIAEDVERTLVGFVQLYPLFSSTRLQKLWLLNDLYVDARFRGRGISIQLVEEAKNLAYATNACGLLLETEISNTIGNQLYPRTGFTLDLEHHHYFWNTDV